MDADEELIAELDVVINKSLASQLYLLQFPLKQAKLPAFNEGEHVKARFKPKQQNLELDIPLNIDSPNVDPIKAEIFAENANIPTPEDPDGDNKMFPKDIMDFYTLASSSKRITRQHALGIVMGGQLHINPLQGVLQMRTSLKYLDEKDKREQAEKEADQAEASSVSARIKQEDEGPTKLTMKYKKRETAKAAAARERSFAHHQAKLQEESWVEMPLIQKSTPRAKDTAQRLIARNGSRLTAFDTNYITAISPAPVQQAIQQRYIQDIQRQAPADAVKELLKQAQAVTLQDVLRYVPNTEQVLGTLQEVGILVRGNWVARSSHIFTQGGRHAQRLIRARDYILWCFQNDRIVKRSDVMARTQLTREEVTAMLKPIAVQYPNYGWRFKMPDNAEFQFQFPEIARSQSPVWKALQQELADGGILVDDAPSH
eukprot:m.158981 g.158981  ORF g.158981 m.158981 type:complete len:429 (-) comp16344_c0_seq6:1433-2719(-)